MTMYFSKTTLGFYSSDINESMPPDAISVAEDLYKTTLAGQSAGQIVSADQQGMPTLINGPQQTQQQLWNAYVIQAQELLDKSDVTIIRCVEKVIAIPVEWETYRASLRSIISTSLGNPNQPLPTRPNYPSGS